MWKCGRRQIKDTVERSANQYEKRSANGTSAWWDIFDHPKQKGENKKTSCCSFIAQKCWKSHRNDNDTKEKRWYYEQINRTWRSAIAWSTAVVFGLYSTQIIHYHIKKNCKNVDRFCVPKVSNVIKLLPIKCKSQKSFPKLDITLIEKLIQNSPVVHAVSNETSSDSSSNTTAGKTSSHNSVSSDGDLGAVLNTIENRLGLAEIECGHYENGLSLLRSASSRDYAPAIYNLGLCYEMGLGVAVDEKIAMELYRTAAYLRHPGALYNLGIYYGQGRGGLARSDKTAMRFIQLAASQGQEDAIAAIKALKSEESETDLNKNVTTTPISEIDKNAPTHSSLFIHNLQLLNFTYEPVLL